MAIWTINVKPLEEKLALFEGNLAGLKAEGNRIFIGSETIEINPSCTGLVSLSVLAAVIFSLRKPELKKKIVIFFSGAIFLFLLNALRIYFVLVIGINYGVAIGSIVHEISWLSTAAFIIILWYYLTKRITKTKEFNELV